MAIATAKTATFDGPCPFALCHAEGPHSHTVCPDCGAVRHGNIFCKTCRAYLDSEQPP